MRLRFPLLFLALSLACGDEGGTPTDAGIDAGEALDATNDAGPLTCEEGAILVTTFAGRVVRADAPETGVLARVQSCVRVAEERLICLMPALNEESGEFAIAFPEVAQCVEELTLRVFTPDDPGLATTYCPVPLTASEGVLSLVTDAPMFPIAEPTELPERGDADAPRTVRFPGELELTLAPSAFTDGTYEALRAAVLDPSVDTCFSESLFDALLVFGPEADVRGENLGVSLPAGELAEGTLLDVYALGGLETLLPDETLVPEGALARVGSARVESGRIVSDDAVPYLGFIGFRVAE